MLTPAMLIANESTYGVNSNALMRIPTYGGTEALNPNALVLIPTYGGTEARTLPTPLPQDPSLDSTPSLIRPLLSRLLRIHGVYIPQPIARDGNSIRDCRDTAGVFMMRSDDT